MRVKLSTSAICAADLPRLEQCPAAGVRAAANPLPPGPAAWRGIHVHKYIELAVNRGVGAAAGYLRSIKSHAVQKLCLRIDLGQLPPGEAEVGFAQMVRRPSVRRVRWPERPDPDCEVYSRPDLIYDEGGQVGVVDFKTYRADVDVRLDAQSLGAACAVAAEQAADSVVASVVSILLSGGLDWRTEVLSAVDLRAFEARVREVHLRVVNERAQAARGKSPAAVTGSECAWCELRFACPAR